MLMQLATAPPKIRAKPVNERRSIMQLKNRSGGLLSRGKKYTFEKTGASAEKTIALKKENTPRDRLRQLKARKLRIAINNGLSIYACVKRKTAIAYPKPNKKKQREKGRDNLFEGSLVQSPQNVSAENAFEFGSPGTYVRKSTINGVEEVLNDLPVLSPTSDASYVTSEEDLNASSPSKKTKHKPFGLKFDKKKRSPEKAKQ